MAKILLVEDNEMNRDKALATGCDDFDTKPVDFARLMGKLDAQLKRGRAA